MSKFLDGQGVTNLTKQYDDRYAKQSIIAPKYDATITYSVDDYCMHNSALCQCTSDIATPEEWNDSHWTIIKLVDKLSSAQIIEATYAELKALKEANQLIPGMQYRITDYVTVARVDTQWTVPKYLKCRNEPFDLIVVADTTSTFNCKARACLHPGSTYFNDNDKLYKWEIWYSFDNDNKYNWHDTSTGKGVIYRMIDQAGNDAPFDFKNILFRYSQPMFWGRQNNQYYDRTKGFLEPLTANNKIISKFAGSGYTCVLPYVLIGSDSHDNVIVATMADQRNTTYNDTCISFGTYGCANSYINMFSTIGFTATSSIANKIVLKPGDVANTTINVSSIDATGLYIQGNYVLSSNKIAAAYDSTLTYHIGDIVTQYAKVYVCNTEIQVAEAWTAAHWTETTLVTACDDRYVKVADALYVSSAQITSGDNLNTVDASLLSAMLAHKQVEFNNARCIFQTEDNSKVEYCNICISGTYLHVNVIDVNKSTGIITFNQFNIADTATLIGGSY